MNYNQFEFPIFVVALTANIALITVVLEYAAKNRSRVLFSAFVIAQMLWIFVNYFAFSVEPKYFLFTARLTMFFATFHAFTFFVFVNNFLSEKFFNSKKITFAIGLFSIVVGFISLTPLVFKKLSRDSFGNLAPEPGPLMPIFGIFVGLCVIYGFYLVIFKYTKATGEEKLQWKHLMIGLILTFLLVVFFSFLNFIFFKNLKSVRFGHLYTLPFILFTSYAMIKHKMLNIKAVVAEVSVIILNLIIFLQLINSETTAQFLVSGFVLIGTLVLGILLVRSVRKEVKQRERLEILTKELENANQKLIVLDKARAEFITVASHQLRTPPATIKWYLSAILAGDFGEVPQQLKEPLTKTNRTNNGLISLIDDMLNLSRIERGKMEFLFQETDPLALAQAVFEQLEPIAKEKGLSLTFHKPEQNLPKLMADQEKLKQVMNNMVDNAIKYTKKGSVHMEISEIRGEIVFEVSDTGKGFDILEQKEIFEKFKRGKDAQNHSAGLGLGMYVAEVIVKQHKGRIWANSKGIDQGATFAFSMPVKNQLSATTLLDLTNSTQPEPS